MTYLSKPYEPATKRGHVHAGLVMAMVQFLEVFRRNLEGKLEEAMLLNVQHIVKIEIASCGLEEVSSIVTLESGEKLEVAGTPEDLLTHDQYFYPKIKPNDAGD